jgi:hypothetical protein
MKKHICLIDFDGTCVVHKYPELGEDIGASPVLRELVSAGHQLILWTMRCDRDKDDHAPYGHDGLTQAVKWFEDRNIPLYGINTNPTQASWTSSPKSYGTLCIDDINLGARLSKIAHLRPFIDWKKTYKDLWSTGIVGYRANVEREIDKERLEMLKSYM